MSRELGAWEMFKELEPVRIGNPSKAIAETRRAHTLEMPDGKRDVKARSEARGPKIRDEDRPGGESGPREYSFISPPSDFPECA